MKNKIQRNAWTNKIICANRCFLVRHKITKTLRIPNAVWSRSRTTATTPRHFCVSGVIPSVGAGSSRLEKQFHKTKLLWFVFFTDQAKYVGVASFSFSRHFTTINWWLLTLLLGKTERMQNRLGRSLLWLLAKIYYNLMYWFIENLKFIIFFFFETTFFCCFLRTAKVCIHNLTPDHLAWK